MRYIFLDSNIFFRNWFFESADFELLANYLQTSETFLLIPEVVVEEVQNLYRREKESAIKELQRSFGRAQQFIQTRKSFDPAHYDFDYDFRKELLEKMSYVVIVPYDKISNKEVVKRAIGNVLPFRENEKGYRDTIIWLSLLQFLSEITNDIDELYFITENSNDFFKGDAFHEQLVKDVEVYQVETTIKPFKSLNQFAEAVLKRDDLNFSDERLRERINNVEDQIEFETSWYLNQMDDQSFLNFLKNAGLPLPGNLFLSRHDFRIDEGIEDGTIVSFKRLENQNIYFHYDFNLRRCTIELTIPEAEWATHRETLERFYSESYVPGIVHVMIFCRIEFAVSFIYNPGHNTIEGLEMNRLKFMQIFS